MVWPAGTLSGERVNFCLMSTRYPCWSSTRDPRYPDVPRAKYIGMTGDRKSYLMKKGKFETSGWGAVKRQSTDLMIKGTARRKSEMVAKIATLRVKFMTFENNTER